MPPPRPARRACLLALAALSLAAPSCGDGPKRKPTFPTEGKLLLNGKAYGGITVFFYSTDPSETEPTRPFGVTNADGTFALTTSAQNDGAPAGEYAVTLLYEPLDSPLMRAAKGPKPPPIDKKFADPKTTPLRAKVEARDKNVLDPLDAK